MASAGEGLQQKGAVPNSALKPILEPIARSYVGICAPVYNPMQTRLPSLLPTPSTVT